MAREDRLSRRQRIALARKRRELEQRPGLSGGASETATRGRKGQRSAERRVEQDARERAEREFREDWEAASPEVRRTILRSYRRSGGRRDAGVERAIARSNRRAPQAHQGVPRTRGERLAASFFGSGLSPFGRRTAQNLIDAAYYAPGGIYEAVKGNAKDLAAASQGDFSFKNDRRFLKALAEGTYEDIRHPLRNPGFTGLTALGAIGAVGGTTSRVAATTKALRAGEGTRRALTRPGHEGGSLLHRPIAGETELKINGKVVAERLEPDAAYLRPFHRRRTRKLQQQLDEGGRPEPKGAVGRFVEDHLAAENVAGREIRARRRVEADHAKAPLESARRGSKKLSHAQQTAMRVLAIEGVHALRHPDEAVGRHAAKHRQWADEGIEPELNRQHAADLNDEVAEILRRRDPEFLRQARVERRLSRRGEREAIERGLLTEDSTVSSRATLAEAYGQPVSYKEGAPRGSWYFPTGEKFKIPTKETRAAAPSRRSGPYGSGPPQESAYTKGTTKHRTGEGAKRGAIEKPGQAIAEAEAGRQRLYSAQDLHEELFAVGSRVRQSDRQTAYRSKREIPDDLRREIDTELEKARNGDESAYVRAQDLLKSHLRDDRLTAKMPASGGREIEGVRWVDERLSEELDAGPAGRIARAASKVNRPFRFLGVYLRPAYIATNLPSNVAIGTAMQGWKIGPNMVRARRARRIYGDETTDWLESVAGTTRTESYRPRGRAGAVEEAVVGAVTKITDRDFRVSSILYRAEERGYVGRKGLERLRTSNDAKVVKDRNAIIRRGRKDAVDFDSLTPAERELVEAIYFYPWTSRATAWSGRAVLNRPIKTAALAQGSKIGKEEQQGALGPLPSWLSGYISTRFGLSNPSPLNPFSTPAAIGRFALHPGRDASFAEEFGTPLLELLSGNPASAAPWQRLAGSTGVGGIARRAGVAEEIVGPPAKSFPPSDDPRRRALDALAPFFLGGPYPRRADLGYLRDEGLKELPPEERVKSRHRDYGDLILEKARETGLLPKDADKLPPQLTRALRVREARYANRERLGAADSRSKFEADVRFLLERKAVSSKTGKPLTAEQARKAIAWAKREPRDQLVEDELRRLTHWYFASLYGDALTDARAKLKEKGVDLPELR